MKSEIVKGILPEPETEFPVLMKSTQADIVVLFTSHQKGVLVKNCEFSGYEMGHYSETWNAFRAAWVRLPDSDYIKLSNEKDSK